MTIVKSLFGFVLFCLCFTSVASVQAEKLSGNTWNQWRGPSRDGSTPGISLPNDLSEEKLKQVWSVDLGPSYSGPIVSEDKVFVTETVEKQYEVVKALDRKTGKELWQYQWEGSLSVPFFAKANGDWIRATPALDGDRLYVAGIKDLLVCLDANTGKQLWQYDFVKELEAKVPSFGFVCSPLIIGQHLYVQAGEGFCKLDKMTGELKWRVLNDGGGMFGSAFSSPYYTNINGVDQILVQTRTDLAGVNPEDGSVLWKEKIPAFRGMNILTPTVIDNTIFTSSYGGKSLLLSLAKSSDDWTISDAWENKAQGYMSSPVVIDGHIYLHLRNQRFTCINIATGEETFTTTPYGKYWSTVTDGEKILALDEKGDLLLINANPEEFELLSERKVADNAWAHIAVAGNEIIVRSIDKVMVYRWE